jgi:transcriptional regulator with XRE-family HTH domain
MSIEQRKKKSRKVALPELRQRLAANLRAALAEVGWSQNELARRSGVSQKQVNNTCRATTATSADIVEALARPLGFPGALLLLEPFAAAAPETRRAYARIIAAAALQSERLPEGTP